MQKGWIVRMSDMIIEIKNVTKKFKNVVALDDISMSLERGKIHGLIGRNGSGKTVLLKCICSFLQPTEGTILINGKKVGVCYPENIGLILEEPGFIDSMSGFKNLKLLASVRNKIDDQQIREVLKLVGLDPLDKKKVKNYSLGMRHRLGIAQAIMEKPEILLLDEPMNGLDIAGVQSMRELFLKLRDEGTTIVMTSHYKEDIEKLCDHTWTMDQGKLL